MIFSQSTLDILIDIVLYSMLGFPLWLVALMVMTWCCPKQLNDNYFKSPHFSDGELAAYICFPLNHLKTLIFICTLAMPKLYRKRNMSNAREYVSAWYLRVARIWLGGLYSMAFIIFGLMGLLIVYIEYFKN